MAVHVWLMLRYSAVAPVLQQRPSLLEECQDKEKQKAIDQAVAAAGRFDAASNPSSSVGDSEGMHENLAA